MATSLRSFQVGIYEEHLEEASFLYEQRRALIKQSDVDWRYIGDFEERLEAHIDALVVGADLAVEVCRRRSDEGDAGELFAAVCVFCRRRGAAILANLLRGLDFSNVERVRSVGDALKYELPDDWRDSSLQAVRQGQGSIAALLGACSATAVRQARTSSSRRCIVLSRASKHHPLGARPDATRPGCYGNS
jgi:hypothetical protein